MRRCLGFCLFLVVLCPVQPIQAADIKVMTQNQYRGADLTPLLTAPSPAMFNALAVATLQQVAASHPAQRILALAAEISGAGPDLVGRRGSWSFRVKISPRPSRDKDAKIRPFVKSLGTTCRRPGMP